MRSTTSFRDAGFFRHARSFGWLRATTTYSVEPIYKHVQAFGCYHVDYRTGPSLCSCAPICWQYEFPKVYFFEMQEYHAIKHAQHYGEAYQALKGATVTRRHRCFLIAHAPTVSCHITSNGTAGECTSRPSELFWIWLWQLETIWALKRQAFIFFGPTTFYMISIRSQRNHTLIV